MTDDEKYAIALAEHKQRMVLREAEYEAEYAATERRIAAMHAQLDALGAPRIVR